jgi:hypothetical protein
VEGSGEKSPHSGWKKGREWLPWCGNPILQVSLRYPELLSGLNACREQDEND